ncbi:flagellar hook-associated protein FlgK [Candidatus Enterococcus willemsii]|uniref:Flagellar hook-associated protein 1 n=1 Tax=Candidatus Enterococcus willemsii TaxID=1857215 RepID=A0ABQ6YX34_9ENTE|nr:flagellar hook-associated protein FlgK [Enterococcus sp. CU12B]KAF1302039.1 flagellar hook-associated protein FlgK [Enterococcus sp. CU12B]
MTGLFGTLGTATRGMNVNQTALQTSGHNIANTNRDGYSRQRIHMQAETPYYMAGVGAIGMGVKATSVDRIVDSFIRGQVNEAYSKFRFYEQKSDALGQLERIMNEPSKTGLINQLSVMYDSWSKLGSNPELATSKTLVVKNSETFTDTIRQMRTQMKQLKGEVIANVEKGALDFNQKIEQLATLNDQIFAIASNGTVPNDLLDTRDTLLKDISGLANNTVKFDKFGRVSSLKIGGEQGPEVLNLNEVKKISVVSGDEDPSNTISLGGDAQQKKTIAGNALPLGTIVIADTTDPDNITVSEVALTEGEIGGFKEAGKEIDERMGELDTFVQSVADRLNAVYNRDKVPGEDFFTFDKDGNLEVNEQLRKNPSGLRTGYGTDEGDGSLAKDMAKVFSEKDGDKMTFADRYNNIVTKNGISKQQADNTAESQLTLLNQLEYKNESVSGVNINEEVSDVIRFSQAFQANARIIQTVSEMLDTLINRTGV